MVVRLNNSKRRIFTKADFDTYPVWVWDDKMENKVPITDEKSSQYDFEIFFIKCCLTISGHVFDGYRLLRNSR